ncbi:hypothetical protein [Variovorax sp. W2I14]|uniref:hypothetical protein n=1 Tax=Variovorax sp. W2I14 TaxID=3042290 RepID=UPI003D1DBBEB
MRAKNALSDNDQADMFLIEGVLSELHVEHGVENLLQKISRHYRGRSVLTGAAAAASGLFGQTANAAMLAMYDGEATQNFACIINGQVVCGQFSGAQLLQEGSRVRVAASHKGDVIVARGILDERQGLVWVAHAWGAGAEKAANWKMAWWFFGLGNAFFAATYWFIGGRGSFLENQLLYLAGLAVLCFGMALWANKDMQALAAPSTEVFRLLGFAEPAKVNLNRYLLSIVGKMGRTPDRPGRPSVSNMLDEDIRNVHDYKQAVEDGRVAMVT